VPLVTYVAAALVVPVKLAERVRTVAEVTDRTVYHVRGWLELGKRIRSFGNVLVKVVPLPVTVADPLVNATVPGVGPADRLPKNPASSVT
jgi:hypothetical protein